MLILKTLFILLVYRLLYVNGNEKGSLVFVIDDTGSMYDDIREVKMKTNEVFDAVLYANSSIIDDFVLVTFNDPDAKLRTITRDRNEFKRALANIEVDGGLDCPEYAMTGIELALEHSKPHSFFYVFTDASAKDYKQYERIKSLSQKKSIQVSFLLTGHCGSYTNDDAVVYDKLSEATSGQVFHIKKDDIHKIIDYIIASITHEKTILGQKTFEKGFGKKMTFTVDSKSWDVIVSISANNPNYKITDPDGNIVAKDNIASTAQSSIDKLKTKPGVYTIEVLSGDRTSVVVTASTYISFEHGFSSIKPASINETSAMPVPGVKSYLAIKFVNDKRDVLLKTAELRDIDDNVIVELPLILINKDEQLYITDALTPPNTAFKIAVNGFLETGEKITRVSSTTVELQKPELEKKVTKKSPKVTLLSDDKIIVEYGKPVEIKCKLHGFPQPDALWEDSSVAIGPSKVVPVDLPYDYITVLNIDKVIKNSTVTCRATNSEGSDSISVKIEVKKRFIVLEYPKDITIEFGETKDLKFIIDAYPIATITWYKNDTEISNDNYYDISPDNMILTIKSMHPKLTGKYTVKAVSDTEERNFSFNVLIIGAESPVIDKNVTDYFVDEGSDVDIHCRLLKGKPKPTIYWSYSDSMELDDTEETIHITNVGRDDTGQYHCSAINDIGVDSHGINLYVRYRPLIYEEDEKFNILKDEQIVLTCSVDGFPYPSIRWFKNNSEISESSKYRSTKDNVLRFRGSEDDSGVYTCEASNVLGTAEKKNHITIYVPINIEPPKENVLYIRVGDSMKLPCIAKGYPEPELKWIFKDIDLKSKQQIMRTNSSFLSIPRLQMEDEGFYICEASNAISSAIVTYEVHILAPPFIENKLLDETLYVVEGDLVLRIPCAALGKPKPTISWILDGFKLARETEMYDIDEYGTLLIKNINKKSQGTYVCKAENPLGHDTKEYNVKVDPYPRTSNVLVQELLEEGTTADIECGQSHRELDLVRWYKNGRLLKTGALTLRDVSKSDSGLYSCRVSNFVSSHSSHKNIVVGKKPEFTSEEETRIEFYEGSFVFLTCSSTGSPKLSFTWFHNGRKINQVMDTIELQMKTSDIGEYKCLVANDFGKISRTFNIVGDDCLINNQDEFSTYQPLILTLSKYWPLFEIRDGHMTIPNNATFLLVCPGGDITTRTLRPLGTQRIAKCIGGTMLKLTGRYIDFKNIKCSKEVKPLSKSTGIRCSKGNTEILKVGYSLRSDFLSVYDICFNKDKNATIYSKHNLHRSLADSIPTKPIKFTESIHLPKDFDSIYNCGSECCFAKKQLVNPRDVSPGYPQEATYNNLNTSPLWSTCSTENWDEVERRVRSLVMFSDYYLAVWTGISYGKSNDSSPGITLRTMDRSAPPYIWKVIRNLQEQRDIVIIQVNIPGLTKSEAARHILCKDICYETEWMRYPEWRDVNKGFTYCCSLNDFKEVFDYKHMFRGSRGILTKMPLVSEISLI